jgi:hypothetical protein
MKEEDDTYDGISLMSGADVKWTAGVAVLCCCEGGRYETRKGTRVFNVTISHEFFANRPGAMPVDISTPTTLLELIGEAAAEIVDWKLETPFSTTKYDLDEIASKVKTTKPSKPTDGKWEGGNSPCD